VQIGNPVFFANVRRVKLARFIASQTVEKPQQWHPKPLPARLFHADLGIAVFIVLASRVKGGMENILKFFRREKLALRLFLFDFEQFRNLPALGRVFRNQLVCHGVIEDRQNQNVIVPQGAGGKRAGDHLDWSKKY